jgi:NAD(P)-dependent dehydrogenase (short-subunit alcohol dehydrogenase family)
MSSERGRSGELPLIEDLISLKGRRAVITGSASGIGRAMAKRFFEAGAELELVDIDESGLASLRGELSEFDAESEIHVVDLSEKNEIDRLWEKIGERPPDILVNNAGIFPFRDFLEVDEAFLGRVMDVNLNSVVWMCQRMVERRKGRGGVIVNVASIEALLPFMEDLVHYSVSKAGVIALTRSLAKEYGRQGFRVNALVPGGINTPGTRNVALGLAKLNLGLLRSGVEFRQRLPMGRAGKPDEVARMALVLASDLSSYVNGALVPVDGGFLSA